MSQHAACRSAAEEVPGKYGGCHPGWQAGCGGRGLQGSWRTNQGLVRSGHGRGLLRSAVVFFFVWKRCESLYERLVAFRCFELEEA